MKPPSSSFFPLGPLRSWPGAELIPVFIFWYLLLDKIVPFFYYTYGIIWNQVSFLGDRYQAWFIVTTGTFLNHELFWLGLNLMYLAFDKYKIFANYKVYNSEVPLDVQTRIGGELALSHLGLLLPIHIVSYPLFEWFGVVAEPDKLPTLSIFLVQMIVFNLVEDFVFYWVHRLLHHPVLFKAVHWKHHRFDQIGGHTFSLNGEYSHYVENLFNDLVPMMCGIFAWTLIYSRLALGPEWSFHIFTFWCWITFRQMRTTDSHSGYDLPYHPLRLFRFIYGGARFHMEHHTLKGRRWNFGAFHLWDYLMGTVLKDRTSADMREPQF